MLVALVPALLLVWSGCGGKAAAPAEPTITALYPTYVIAGTGGFTLDADVRNARPGQILLWNGNQLRTEALVGNGPADYVALSAPVPAGFIAEASLAKVSIFDPSTGFTSAPFPMGVAPPQQAYAGAIALVSIAPDGSPADGDVRGSSPAISADGRYVVFQDSAGNLSPGSELGQADIYLRDNCIDAPPPCTPGTIRVSVAADGGLANGGSESPSISGNGRYVAFASEATNIVLGARPPVNGFDVYVRDTCNGAGSGCAPSTTLQSAAGGDDPLEGGNGATFDTTGRFLSFSGYGSNGHPQVYWRDTCAGAPLGCAPATLLESPAYTGGPANFTAGPAELGATGRFLAFQSSATDLVPGDNSSQSVVDIFLRDTCQGAPAGCSPSTLRADLSNSGQAANVGAFTGVPAVSADGRYVAFQMQSNETAIAPNPGGVIMAYVRDTCTGAPAGCQPQTIPIAVATDGSQPNAGSSGVSMTPDGRFVAFDSLASNLVYGDPGPAGNQSDIFVRDTCLGASTPCTPATVWVSVGPNQTPSFGDCVQPAISADGHYVAFLCVSDNLVTGSYNGHLQVYLAKTGF